MRYGIWSKVGYPFHDIGIVEVDMLSKRVKEMTD